MRIDKLLSSLNYGSRKEIGKAVKKYGITVNDKLVKDVKVQVDPINDTIVFLDELIYYSDSVLLMMNKPSGYECSHNPERHDSIYDLIEDKYNRLKVNTIGRLDQDTTGLILFTNDGQFLHQVTSPKKEVYKVYLVTVEKPFTNCEILESNYTLTDHQNRPYSPQNVSVKKINDTQFELSIHEGKYHQVKEMCKHFGYTVTNLHRLRIGDLDCHDLELGEVREITKKERKLLI